MFKETERAAQRDLRAAVKNGLQPWAQKHCDDILQKARYHREEAAVKSTSRERRDFAFNRAIGECLQVSALCSAFMRHGPNVQG